MTDNVDVNKYCWPDGAHLRALKSEIAEMVAKKLLKKCDLLWMYPRTWIMAKIFPNHKTTHEDPGSQRAQSLTSTPDTHWCITHTKKITCRTLSMNLVTSWLKFSLKPRQSQVKMLFRGKKRQKCLIGGTKRRPGYVEIFKDHSVVLRVKKKTFTCLGFSVVGAKPYTVSLTKAHWWWAGRAYVSEWLCNLM